MNSDEARFVRLAHAQWHLDRARKTVRRVQTQAEWLEAKSHLDDVEKRIAKMQSE